MSRVTVTIDRVRLQGLDAAEQRALVDALRVELARVLADPARVAALTQTRRTPVLRLTPLRWEPGVAGARQLGRGIARGIGAGQGLAARKGGRR